MKKMSKTMGIIVSILLIVCGIIFFAMPARMAMCTAWFLLGSLIANGIYKIVAYCTAAKESRSGWILADGIVSTLLGALVLYEVCVTPILTTLGIVGGMGFIVGFFEVFTGVTQLCNIKAVKAAGKSVGWTITMGIINIICGIFVMAYPIISTIALEWILAIYLVVFGTTSLISVICDK